MNRATGAALAVEGYVRNAAQIKLSPLQAVILDSVGSATRGGLAGDDEIEVSRQRNGLPEAEGIFRHRAEL